MPLSTISTDIRMLQRRVMLQLLIVLLAGGPPGLESLLSRRSNAWQRNSFVAKPFKPLSSLAKPPVKLQKRARCNLVSSVPNLNLELHTV